METIESRLKVVVRQGDEEKVYYSKGWDEDCEDAIRARLSAVSSSRNEGDAVVEIYKESRYHTDSSDDSDIPSLYVLIFYHNYHEPVYATTDYTKAKEKFIQSVENIRKDWGSMEGYTEEGDMFDRCIEFRRGNYFIGELKMKEIKLVEEEIVIQ